MTGIVSSLGLLLMLLLQTFLHIPSIAYIYMHFSWVRIHMSKHILPPATRSLATMSQGSPGSHMGRFMWRRMRPQAKSPAELPGDIQHQLSGHVGGLQTMPNRFLKLCINLCSHQQYLRAHIALHPHQWLYRRMCLFFTLILVDVQWYLAISTCISLIMNAIDISSCLLVIWKALFCKLLVQIFCQFLKIRLL